VPIDPVIDSDALPSLGAFHLLDVREPVAFEAGHPAAAVRVPIEVWEAAAKAGETSFENVAYWERPIADLGIDGRIAAVVYDDGRMTEAARVWFVLQYFGAEAFILNGGLPAIQGREDLLGAAAAPAPPGGVSSKSVFRIGWACRPTNPKGPISMAMSGSSMPVRLASSQAKICGATRAVAICQLPGCFRMRACSTLAA
jgi:rhodanese-related sulfurtransferase